VTRQANWNEVRELSLQAGSWDNMRASFDLGNGFSDTIAARITGVYEDSESYRDGFELEKKGVNPTVAFALGDRTLLRLSYEYFDYDRIADRGIPSLDGRPFGTDESTFFGDPAQSPTHATVNQGTIVVDHAFGDNLRLRNRTQYSDYDKFYQNVFAGGEVDAASGTVQLSAYNNEQLRENVFNQTDLLFGFDTGGIHHDFLAGVELGEQVTDNFRNTGFFNDSEDPFFVSAADPTVSVPVTFRQSETDADNHGRATIAAAYVQDQIVLSPQWEAVLGLRFDQFDMDFTNNRTGDRFRTSDELLSPRAGLIYKPQEATALYASYSMTHIPRAGAQLNQLSLTNEALDPEEFENVEVGVKWDARPGLALTAALFQLDRKNVAIPHPTIPGVSLLVDGQRTEGLEVGASGRLNDAWSIQGGYAWQQGEVTETASSIPGGARLAQLPKHVASLWNKLDLTPQWGVGLGVIHQTEMFAAIAPAEDLVTLPEFTRVDAAVFYTPNERLRIQANVENLFDEKYYPNAHNSNNISPGSPLAVRVGVTASF
jgi:catecholate siderophore receptor